MPADTSELIALLDWLRPLSRFLLGIPCFRVIRKIPATLLVGLWLSQVALPLHSASVAKKPASVSASVNGASAATDPVWTGSLVLNGGAAYANKTAATAALSASSDGVAPTQRQFSWNGTIFNAWEAYSATRTVTLPTGDGVKTLYVKYQDAVGNISGVYSDSITLDQTIPTGTVVINGGASAASSLNVTLTLSASDALSGVTKMQFSQDNATWSALEAYATSKAYTLAGTGTQSVYVRFQDGAGNLSSVASSSIVAWTGSLTLNAGAACAAKTAATAAFTAACGTSTITNLQLSWNGSTFLGWETFVASRNVTLPTGDGTKTLYVKFQNANGDVSPIFSDSILLDTTAPAGSVLINGGSASTTSSTVTLTLSATDGGSGVSQMQLSPDNVTWSALEAYATSKSYALATGAGSRSVYARFTDGAGNVFQTSANITVYIWSGSLLLNGGAASATLQAATATLAAANGGTSPVQMQLSWNGTTFNPWEAYVTTRNVTLPNPAGVKTLSARFKDASGNISPIFSDDISLVGPAITSFAAAKATITAGQSTTLTGVFATGTGAINNGVGSVNSGSTVAITPSATTSYLLTVTSASGVQSTQSSTVSVVAAPEVPVITAPANVTANQAGYSASVPMITGCTFAWTITGGTFAGGATTAAGASVSFTAGTGASLTLSCTSTNAAGTVSTAGTKIATVVAAPTITGFTAASATVSSGSNAVLTAVFSGGTGAVDNGAGAVSSGTPFVVLPPTTTTYILTVTNVAGTSITSSLTLTVVGTPWISSFSASPFGVKPGSGSTLSWNVSNATSLSIDPGVGTVTGTSLVVNPATTTTYILKATGPGGSMQDSAQVTVTPTGIPDPAPSIHGGTKTVRIWHTLANNCALSRSLGAFQAGDVVTAKVWFKARPGLGGTLFLGSYSNSSNAKWKQVAATGLWQELNITHTVVAADTLNICIYGNRHPAGNNATERDFVSYDDVLVSSVNRGQVLSDDFEAGFSAWDSAGQRTDFAVPVLPTIWAFSASPVVVAPGGAVTLTWQTTNAYKYQIDPGGLATSGTQLVVNPTATTNYTLTAVAADGSSTRLATALVTPSGSLVSNVHTGGAAVRVWHKNGSDGFIRRDLGAFDTGDLLTSTLWFKAAPGVYGQVYLGDPDGADPDDNSATQSVEGNGDWQSITLTHTMTHADAMALKLYGDNGHAHSDDISVLYDDVMVKSSKNGLIIQDGFEHGTKAWIDNSTILSPVTSSNATTFNGAKAVSIWHDMTTNNDLTRPLGNFNAGDIITATLWFKCRPGMTGTLWLGAFGENLNTNSSSVQMPGNGDWQQISVVHNAKFSEPLYLVIYGDRYTPTSGVATADDFILHDELRVTSTQHGLLFQDGFEDGTIHWVPHTSHWTSLDAEKVALVPDESTAYRGSHAVGIWHDLDTNNDMTRSLDTFEAGDVVTASLWFKCRPGMTGTLWFGAFGANLNTNSTSVQMPGTGDWQQITVVHTVKFTEPMYLVIYGDRYTPTSSTATTDDFVLHDDVCVRSLKRGVVLQDGFEDGTGSWTASARHSEWLTTPMVLNVPVVAKPGDQVAFTARVSGFSDQSVTWSASSGSIVNGLYTVPQGLDQTVQTITATSIADPRMRTGCEVAISATGSWDISGSFTDLKGNLGTNTIHLNGNETITDSSENLNGTIKGSLWTGTGSKGWFRFVFSGDGDSFNGFYGLTSPSAVSSNYAASGVRTLGLVAVRVDPASMALTPNQGVSLVGQVAGSRNKALTWSIVEPAGGTLVASSDSSVGTYTPPDAEGIYHVKATSVVDPTQSGSSTVTVVPSILLTPDYGELKPGASLTLRANVLGNSNKTVNWSIQEGAAGGTLSGGAGTNPVIYKAPAAVGSYHVVATSSVDGNLKGVATLVVAADALISVAVSPYEIDLNKGGTTTFTAQVNGGITGKVTWSVLGSGAGTINASTGIYTAPSAFGTYTVMATSTEDATAYATATVTVKALAGTDKNFSYDLNGNMTSDGARNFEWDAENRLIAVTIIATGHRSEFAYDGLGRRVVIRELDVVSTVLTETSNKKYLWDGVEIAEERDTTGANVTKQFYAQGFVDSDLTKLYYTRDHLGSIRELTDSSQVVRARYDYDPYGRMTKISGDRDSFLGYTNMQWHMQSGLNLTMFRAYDPNVGRWISQDPIGELGGVNLYDYVVNNPISFGDELGLNPGVMAFPAFSGAGITIGSVSAALPLALLSLVLTTGDAIPRSGTSDLDTDSRPTSIPFPPGTPKCKRGGCKPCNPSVGTVMWERYDTPPSEPHYIKLFKKKFAFHTHYVVVTQDPYPSCVCREMRRAGGEDIVAPGRPLPGIKPYQPVTGGGPE